MHPLDYVTDIFNSVMESRVFRSREKLSLNYVPDFLPHRESEVRKVASALAPALKGERPDNTLIYGLRGTGKTAVIRYVLSRLEASANVKGIYVDAVFADSPYRIIASIGEAVGVKLPYDGYPLSNALNKIVKKASEQNHVYVIVLDNLDLVRGKKDLIHALMKIYDEFKFSMLCVSKELKGFEEELFFPPYKTVQLKDILEFRAREAFNPGALDSDVIDFCASYAYGDAKKAMKCLKVAGETAERLGSEKVLKEHAVKAREEIEKNRIISAVRALPSQSKLVLLSILVATKDKSETTTGEVYEKYKKLTAELGLNAVTLRRVSGILDELESLEIILGKVVSKGRYGKTRVIELKAEADVLAKVLSEDFEENFGISFKNI